MDDKIVLDRFKRIVTRYNDDILSLRIPNEHVRLQFIDIVKDIEKAKTLFIGDALPPLRAATISEKGLVDFFASAFPNQDTLLSTIFKEAYEQPLIISLQRDIWVLSIIGNILYAIQYCVYKEERISINAVMILSEENILAEYKKGFTFDPEVNITYFHAENNTTHNQTMAWGALSALFFAMAYKTLLMNRNGFMYTDIVVHPDYVQEARIKRNKNKYTDIAVVRLTEDFGESHFKYINSTTYKDAGTGEDRHRRGYLVIDRSKIEDHV